MFYFGGSRKRFFQINGSTRSKYSTNSFYFIFFSFESPKFNFVNVMNLLKISRECYVSVLGAMLLYIQQTYSNLFFCRNDRQNLSNSEFLLTNLQKFSLQLRKFLQIQILSGSNNAVTILAVFTG